MKLQRHFHHEDTKTQRTAKSYLDRIYGRNPIQSILLIPSNKLYLGVFVSSWFIFCSGLALAQSPEIATILPAGAPRGGVTTIRVTGKNLAAGKVFISGKGVTIQSVVPDSSGSAAEVKLVVAGDAPLGCREVRIGTTHGVSHPAWICVDVFPNALETGQGDAAHPQALEKTPIVLNGVIKAAGEHDVYAVTARAGETWAFEVNAGRIHSPLSPLLELLDADGRQLARGEPAQGGDPRILHKFEKDGRYQVAIRDSRSQGGPDFDYRLALGAIPVVTSVIPHGEKPGRNIALQLTGVNLGATRKTVVSIPADTPPGLYWTTVKTVNGFALPFPLLIDFLPVVGLTETDALMPLPTLPCSLEGAFATYPRLKFAFQAGPKDTLLFDLFGRRIGSSVSGMLQITDMAGKEIASRAAAQGGDSQILFTPQSEGIYVVELSDRQGRTGADHYYRLAVQRAAPDFRLLLETDRLELPAGGSTKLTVRLERLGGFDGPVTISAAPMPRGLTFGGGAIAAGQTTVELTLTAAPNAISAPSLITLRGSTVIGGKSVTRAALPQAQVPAASTGAGPASISCQLLPLAITK